MEAPGARRPSFGTFSEEGSLGAPGHAAHHRPLHASPTALVLVLVGGFFGAASRQLVEQAVGTPADGFPWGTLAVNLGGAFALGALIEALARAGHHPGGHSRPRLLAGTGFLGAFTTYSTLAVETDLLVHAGRVGVGVVYLAVSAAGGLACAAAGIWVAGLGARVPVTALPIDPDVDEDGDDGADPTGDRAS